MNTFEMIKFVEFYLLEAVVVALFGLTAVAGLYQIVRSKVRGASTHIAAPRS